MKKAIFFAMATTMGLGLFVSGCSGNTGSTNKASSNKNGKTAAFTTIDEYHPITVGAPMNPFNTKGNTFLGYDVYQLGWSKHSATNVNAFYKGLASNWSENSAGNKVTITIQPGAKWSDGTPVTPQDIITSMAVAFTQGNAQAFYLGSVKKVGSNQVEFDQLPGSHYNLFLEHVLSQPIVPNEVYGPQLPNNIWTLIKEANYQGNNAAQKATSKKAGAKLTALGKTIAKFAPKKDISAGPFVIKSLNPGEAVLNKNPDFYNAKKVHINQVVFRNYTGNQQIWNYLIAGQLDVAPFTAMSQSTMKKILATKGNKKVIYPSYVSASLAFNESTYPYNMLQVRKALAYLINRPAVQKVAEPAVGKVDTYTDGMVDAATKSWLTSSQMSQLNKYDYNTAKAAQLLKSAGFTKKGNQWYMPNGKAWKATIETVNGFNDWIEAGKVISNEMSSFGIPTNPKMSSSYAQYLKNLAAGKFAIGFWLDALGPAAYNTYVRIYGTPDGYNVVGGKLTRYAAKDKSKGNWINLPSTVKLPDGTSVNPGKLTYSLNSLSQANQKAVVQKLALATNENVPLIELWDYIGVEFTNNSRFTDYPTQPSMLANPAGVWIGSGYVQPK